jgi:hypothetical protein
MISSLVRFLIVLAFGLAMTASAQARASADLRLSWTISCQPTDRHSRQSPRDVTVRPRVSTAEPGIPSVTVTVDRRAVPLGELVTFSFSPVKVVLDPRYSVIISFGDGKHLRITQPQVDHLYTKTGTFTYSLLVKLSELKPSVSQPLPGVKLIGPAQAVTGRAVNFRAELSQSYPNIKFRFVFDDGSQTDWQTTRQATHIYGSRGLYHVYVDIGLGEGQATKQVGGSVRQSIEVKEPPAPLLVVDLTASKVAVSTKEDVTFLAHLRSDESKVSYRFFFGDQSGPTEWQASPQIKHVYLRPGTFFARVEVRSQSRKVSAQSKQLLLKVQPPSLPKVDLIAMPATVPKGLSVILFATTESFNAKIRYRFHFGDGAQPSAWKGSPREVHIYADARDYQVFVEIGFAGPGPIKAIAASGKKNVQVISIDPKPGASPTPTPTPDETTPTLPVSSPSASASPSATTSPSPKSSASGSPVVGGLTPMPSQSPPVKQGEGDGKKSWGSWWMYLLAAIILIAGYRIWRYFFVPPATLVPNLDRGDSQLGAEGGPLAFNFQMELDPSVTDGEFKIDTAEGSLIKSERKQND